MFLVGHSVDETIEHLAHGDDTFVVDIPAIDNLVPALRLRIIGVGIGCDQGKQPGWRHMRKTRTGKHCRRSRELQMLCWVDSAWKGCAALARLANSRAEERHIKVRCNSSSAGEHRRPVEQKSWRGMFLEQFVEVPRKRRIFIAYAVRPLIRPCQLQRLITFQQWRPAACKNLDNLSAYCCQHARTDKIPGQEVGPHSR